MRRPADEPATVDVGEIVEFAAAPLRPRRHVSDRAVGVVAAMMFVVLGLAAAKPWDGPKTAGSDLFVPPPVASPLALPQYPPVDFGPGAPERSHELGAPAGEWVVGRPADPWSPPELSVAAAADGSATPPTLAGNSPQAR